MARRWPTAAGSSGPTRHSDPLRRDVGWRHGRLPLEAVLVWMAAPFSCVLTYEAMKAWQYRRRPDKRMFIAGGSAL